jgi:hypothetical protein
MMQIAARSKLTRALAAAAMLIIAPCASLAQQSLGFHGGVSINPEQAVAGAYWQSPPLTGPLAFRGGFDSGMGDDEWVGTINLDLVFGLRLGKSPWSVVQGGGAVVAFNHKDSAPFRSDNDTAVGASYMIALTHDKGFYTMLRASGGGDVPKVKFLFGWAIRLD